MKNKLMLFLIAFTLVLSSCVKDAPDGTEGEQSGNNGSGGTIPESNIPPDFDWSSTMDIRCDFTSPKHKSKVSLYLPDAKESFATFFVGGGADDMTISVPKTATKILLRYKKNNAESEPQTLTITNNTIKFTVPEDSDPVVNVYSDKDKPIKLYYPSSGMGTFMFEDLWPSYGDFDFNDMAVNYRIELNLDHNNKANEILVMMRIAAIGGNIPYTLYLQLDDVKSSEIDESFLSKHINDKNATISKVTNVDPKSPAIFKIDNIRKNVNSDPEHEFVNVGRGHELAVNDMVEVVLFFDFGLNNNGSQRESINISKLSADSFNFFLGKPEDSGLREIHIGGQNPSVLGLSIYNKTKSSSELIKYSKQYYYSNTNLVWGISIPEVIPHAYEGTPFNEAYPKFISWAESGGKKDIDWYSSDNRVSKNLIEY